MRKLYAKLLASALLLCSSVTYGQSDLMITGVIDADLPGGLPKSIEIYVMNDVDDLSIYGLGAANNGGGTDGEEFTFPAEAATAGSYIYIASETDNFVAYFGFEPTYVNGDAAGINGDDAVELFQNGEVVDLYGDPDTNGDGEAWDYTDSWAYRNNGSMPSPTFDIAEWNALGLGGIDGETENATSANPWPLGTFSSTVTSLLITGVIDADLPGGLPKAIELYVLNDIDDLSAYGLGSANNGGGTDGEEFTFPAEAAAAGSYIYVASETDNFTTYFGFAPTYVSGDAAGINGDDAVELFQGGEVIDLYGDPDTNGDGEAWDYTDSWAYRVNGTGPSAAFDIAEWNALGLGGIDGETDNATSANPWPLGTYSPEGDGGGSVMATIAEIQETADESGDSPLVGQTVITSGIVTAVAGNGYWIQDGTGAWSGLFVRQDDSGMALGDDVTVEAVVQENFGLTRLNDIVNTTVNSNGNPVPAVTAVSTADAGTEQYESVLIATTAATCTNDDLGFGEWEINDGTGAVRVDDAMYDAGAVAFLGYDVTGVLTFSFSNFKILPRDAADVVLNPDADAFGLSFETGSDNVSETDGTVMYNVEISSAQVGETTVEVAVTGGTAVNGEHFNFTSPTTLTFPDGDATPQSISIEIVDDALANEDRTIELSLQNATDGSVFGTETLTITILDDDEEVVITDIAVAAEIDGDGVAINIGNEYTVQATVYGVNMNGAGLSFTLIDATGGMGVYSNDPLDDYVVTEGDIIQMTGTMSQFNGLTQMNPTSIILVSQDNPINEPVTVTELNEFSESNLIRLECVYLLEPGQWDNEGSGFTVDVSNGEMEFALRIDNDVDLYSMAPPEGAFNVVGIGGQFDPEAPLFDGYQLLPRSSADITADDCGFVLPPANDNCTSAADISDLLGGPTGEPQISTIYTNVEATITGNTPEFVYECFGEPDGSGSAPSLDADVWFTFVGDGSTYLIETTNCEGTTNYIPDGDTQMLAFSSICAFATPIGCNDDGPNAVEGDYAAGLEIATIAGQEYQIAIDGFANAQGEFCMSVTMLAPANDLCEDAADLNDLVGGDVNVPQTSGSFSNVGATSENDPDPNAEDDCWFGDPLTSNTTWYTFTGDGNEYFIETLDCGVNDYIDDGDTQMAIYTGECGNFAQIACNEDQSGDIYAAAIQLQTEEGVEYHIMIDGYEGADGEFCVQMTNVTTDGLADLNAFEMDVFPNPAKDNVVVVSQEVIEAAVLTNVVGATVKEFQFTATQRAEFDVTDVAAGVYLLQVRSGNSFATSKLVIE